MRHIFCVGTSPIKPHYIEGVVYIMDHEVVPRPCKICDWLLNSSWDHFGLHQGNNVRVIMEFEVPKRHILRTRLSTDMVQCVLQWERQKKRSRRKRQGPMAKKWRYDKKINEIMFWGREDEDKKRQENDQTLFCFKCLFWAYLKKNQHFHFLVHGHSSWSTFGLHLVRGPKALYIDTRATPGLQPSSASHPSQAGWTRPWVRCDPISASRESSPRSGNFLACPQWSGRFFCITGWNLSVCKSDRLHVHILRFFFH